MLDTANWEILTTTASSTTGQRIYGTFTGDSSTATDLTYQHTVTNPPTISISQQPTATSAVNTALNPAPAASASAGASGTLTYQWSKSTDGTNYEPISGQTSTTLTYSPTAIGSYTFRCTVTETTSSTTETAYATTSAVTVVSAPTLSSTVTIDPDEGALNTQYAPTITFTITGMGGAGTVYYKLQTSTDGGSSWTDTGATGTATVTGDKTLSDTFTDTAATTHTYRVLATTLSGTYSGTTLATSSTVQFKTYAAPVFTSVTAPQGGGVPLTITFSATASDATSVVYLLSSNDVTYTEITSPYTINTAGTYYWKAKATGVGGTTYTSVTTFTASDLVPVFSSASVSPTSGIGRFTVVFTASASNSPTYTWYEYSNGVDTQIGTGASLSYIMQNRASGNYTFRCKAANTHGTTYSSLLIVTVGATPQTDITAPSNGATKMENTSIAFTASYSGTFASTFAWSFGDGGTGTGASTTHMYNSPGTYTVTCTGTNQFGSDSDTITLTIIEYSLVSIDIDDVTATGVTAIGSINNATIKPDTTMYFIVKSKSGQVIWKTDKEEYYSPVSYTADGMPLIAGQQYTIQALVNNGYGNSTPATFTLDNASRDPQTPMDTIYTDTGLARDPFNVSKLLTAGIGAYAGALGGGTVGAAIAFGLIVVFVAVGLWLRQGHYIIPLGIALAGGWFIIGNLPGEWQPIAYTLMVLCIIGILFVLFRKQHE